MRSIQFVACLAMVKTLLVKTDDLEFDPMVLAVAGYTSFGPHFLGGMKTLALVDARFQLEMAIQTFLF